MKTPKANRVYLARDVYSSWKRCVSKAQTRITVYSPYFDRLLLSLLKNAKLAPALLTVVTDFNPASLLQQSNQLRTIKQLLSKGISVLSLRDLHAKVLLVDDRLVSIGSQNFTSHGRRAKECTAVPLDTLDGSRLVKTLLRWREEAEPIDEELVDMLISKLSKRMLKFKRLIDATQKEFDEVCEQHEQEKQNALIRRLEELERQSKIQMSDGVVYASIVHIYSESNDYDSLIADRGYDMTKWIIKKSQGRTEPYRLSRLDIYPIIISENNRMGFARIGKTRITYLRNGVHWTGQYLELGVVRLNVSLDFPETDTRKRNIVLKLSHVDLGSCEADFLFTGHSVKFVEKRTLKGSRCSRHEYDLFVSTLENEFFASTKQLNAFFQTFFKGFRFARLGRDKKNVSEYFKGDRFRLSVIQYQDNPFLVVTKATRPWYSGL